MNFREIEIFWRRLEDLEDRSKEKTFSSKFYFGFCQFQGRTEVLLWRISKSWQVKVLFGREFWERVKGHVGQSRRRTLDPTLIFTANQIRGFSLALRHVTFELNFSGNNLAKTFKFELFFSVNFLDKIFFHKCVRELFYKFSRLIRNGKASFWFINLCCGKDMLRKI